MNGESKAIHPFFKENKTIHPFFKARKAVAKDPDATIQKPVVVTARAKARAKDPDATMTMSAKKRKKRENSPSPSPSPSPPPTMDKPAKSIVTRSMRPVKRDATSISSSSSSSSSNNTSKGNPLVTEAKLVASCSYSTFTPMEKPKFESDLVNLPSSFSSTSTSPREEEEDPFANLRILEEKKKMMAMTTAMKDKRKKNYHNAKAELFDMLYPDRTIFESGHVHLRDSLTEANNNNKNTKSTVSSTIPQAASKPIKCHNFFSTKNSSKKMDSTKAFNNYFIRLKQQRVEETHSTDASNTRLRRKSINSNNNNNKKTIRNHDELEAWLDQHFPLWRSFPSCHHIVQSITFSKQTSNKQKSNIDQQQQQQQQHTNWIDKYRPKETSCLLGSQRNSAYLKYWLQQMKIKPMSAPANASNKKASSTSKSTKKKRKTKNLDDFIDDSAIMMGGSYGNGGFGHLDGYLFQNNTNNTNNDKNMKIKVRDDDEDDDDFMMGPSKKQSQSQSQEEEIQSNVLLLVGDCGVGKTAAVYTAAEEVGYEVFEINGGTKRSGKEIMAAVGDMTKNHLVTFEVKTEQIKKRRLNPFMSAKASTTPVKEKGDGVNSIMIKNFLRKDSDIKKSKMAEKTITVTKNVTKQSLILLEEVDLLYEEDKGFWSAVSELSQTSKRPIIMTCNDPSQIPADTLYLQAVLDLEPPSDSELLPYLWLICFKEGYQVDPVDVICLMAILGRDIRQLLQTLELYCGHVHIFARFLGFDQHTSILELKKLCAPSKTAVDTFRLARFYQEYYFLSTPKKTNNKKQRSKSLDETMKEEDSLDDIEKALEMMSCSDTWLAREERGNTIEESRIDQICGFVNFTKTDETRTSLQNLESTMSILSSQQLNTREWQNFILDEPSHWEELYDAKCCTFDDYYDSVEKLLPSSMVYNPEDNRLMMEYIPYIQAMIEQPDNKNDPKTRQTRSKRKRLHLPLNDDQVDVLTRKRKVTDETLFWCDHFPNK